MILQVIAAAAPTKGCSLDLMDHERVVIRYRTSFHLAELHQRGLQRLVVREVLRVPVEAVVPLVAGALVIVPPTAPFFRVGPMRIVVVRRVPGLRRLARDKAVVEYHRT